MENPISAGLTAGATSAMSLLPTFLQIGQTFGAGMGTKIGLGVTAAIMVVSGFISWWAHHEQEEYEKTAEY
jgi:hypothetical protein